MNSKEIVLHNDVKLVPGEHFSAGGITVLYETGSIRYIMYEDREVIRMMYTAIRDEHWRTVPVHLKNEVIDKSNESISISYTALYAADEIQFEADILIKINPNELSFEMKGRALSSFKTKRTGICVLHPVLSCAGMPVDIIKPGGKLESSEFPVLISGNRPFTDITGLRWRTNHNVEVEMKFEGELFETEDQRNWSDDSYKTYSGPQYLVPMIHMHEGDLMHQKIILKLNNAVENSSVEVPPELLHEKSIPFPRIGYKRAENQQALTSEDIDLFSKIPFDYYLFELRISSTESNYLFNIAINEAIQLQTKLRMNVFFNTFDDHEYNALLEKLALFNANIESVLILSENRSTAPHDQYVAIHNIIKNQFSTIQVGYGSNSWYANINSNLPVSLPFDFLGFTLSPQTHLTDSRTVLENLDTQQLMIRSLCAQLKPVPLQIFVMFSKTPDVRLRSNFGAWWMINAIANSGKAPYLALFELKGDNGIVNNSGASPLYDVLKEIHAHKPVRSIIDEMDGLSNPLGMTNQSKICMENENRNMICFMMTTFNTFEKT